MLLKNPLKFGLLAILGEMFTFVGKIFVGIATALLGYIIIANAEVYTKVLYSPYIPTFVSTKITNISL
jgi:hypothetical protein